MQLICDVICGLFNEFFYQVGAANVHPKRSLRDETGAEDRIAVGRVRGRPRRHRSQHLRPRGRKKVRGHLPIRGSANRCCRRRNLSSSNFPLKI